MDRINGAATIDESTPYKIAVEQWACERKVLGYVQPCTAKKAQQKALLLAPWIGETKIGEIEPRAISQALIHLGSFGGKAHTGLSPATLRAAHLAGSQAIEWAIAQGASCCNPFRSVARPVARYRQSRFLTAPEAQLLSEQMRNRFHAAHEQRNAQETSFCLAVCIAIATGMRRGEIFALEWPDINFDTKRISISKAIKGDGALGEPKSKSSIRSVAFGGSLASLLQLANAQASCNSRVISNQDGTAASMNAFEHWWRKTIDAIGFEGLRFHELRHTHATLLISKGADIKTVQTRLGHASAEITLSIYAHAIPFADAPVASMLDEMLFQ